MDKLKQYIQNNREMFDQEELPVGHELRFMQKLSRKRNRVKLFACYALAVAASVAVLIMSVFPFSEKKDPLSSDLATVTMTTEISELQLYYNMQMREIVDRIESFNPGNGTLEKQQVLKEAKRVLAMSKLFEESVVPQLPSFDETLFAMTQYYGTSIRSLNFMLEQMEKIQSFNE